MGFEVGKKYRRRDGGAAKCIALVPESTKGETVVWLREDRSEDSENISVFTTGDDGNYATESDCNDEWDIISDYPIREPVKVKINHRFVVVYAGDLVSGNYSHEEDARAAAIKGNAIGVGKLPAEIEVTPIH
jgi:hypothetical protein